MGYLSTYAHIAKVGEDLHHYRLNNKLRQIAELVDGPKLKAMLERESLVDTNGEPVSAESILNRLDATEIGQEVVVAVIDRVE